MRFPLTPRIPQNVVRNVEGGEKNDCQEVHLEFKGNWVEVDIPL